MKFGVQPSRLAVAKPLYSQVREMLLRRIGGGEWGAGEALPNEFVLATDFGVSIGTIRRAIEGLEETGVLKRVQGRGTYVAGPGSMALDDKFCRLRIADKPPPDLAYELDGVREREASEAEMRQLALRELGPVTEIRQRVLVGGLPVGYEVSVVDAARFPRMASQFPYGQLVYRVFAEYGVLVTRSSEGISAVAAGEAVAAALGIDTTRSVLEVFRISRTIDKEPVEVRLSHYCLERVTGLSYAALIT